MQFRIVFACKHSSNQFTKQTDDDDNNKTDAATDKLHTGTDSSRSRSRGRRLGASPNYVVRGFRTCPMTPNGTWFAPPSIGEPHRTHVRDRHAPNVVLCVGQWAMMRVWIVQMISRLLTGESGLTTRMECSGATWDGESKTSTITGFIILR